MLKLTSSLWPNELDEHPIKSPSDREIELLEKYRESDGSYLESNKAMFGEKKQTVQVKTLKNTVELVKRQLSEGRVFGVSVNILHSREQLRSSGSIYSQKSCQNRKTDHSMLLIGYEGD